MVWAQVGSPKIWGTLPPLRMGAWLILYEYVHPFPQVFVIQCHYTIISIIVSILYKTTLNADLQIYRHKLEHHILLTLAAVAAAAAGRFGAAYYLETATMQSVAGRPSSLRVLNV